MRCSRARSLSTAASRCRASRWPIRTYGTLNAARNNAVLVCHALTGDQYVAETAPGHRQGWLVGRGGRAGPAGGYRTGSSSSAPTCWAAAWAPPAALAARRMRPACVWGTDFPPVTIRDMVRAQKLLIDHLGIARLFAVMGGSMGGMQVLQWAAELSRRGVRRPADRHRGLPFGAEHRLPRGRPPGDLRRPGLAGRALLGDRPHPGPRPGGGPDVRAHHLPVGAGADPQVRPPAAERAEGPQRGDQPVRRHVRGGNPTCATRAPPSCSASTPTPT